jgi:hypothetical protein
MHYAMRKADARRSRWLPRLVLALVLLLATWPAWRVLLLDSNPTVDELLSLICTARGRLGG